MTTPDISPPPNFIRNIVEEDIKNNKNNGQVLTRFPPEPNGYLHLGHAKSICLNFGLAKDYKGRCHLRFDDTDPTKESMEYVLSFQEDVKWMGFDWGQHRYFASDYFDKLYDFAVLLIKKGKAYVDSLSADEIREYRGTFTEPGKESPYRNRPIEENLDLFSRMKAGEFPDGAHVLRAKIDMASPNIVMRDPVIYRIRKIDHYRTGSQWCIYPMYDFTHCLSDSMEGITHSICTLEFEINRPLYDWVLDALETPCHPQQIEFAKLNLTYTLLSKRKLIQLVEEKYVSGWNDPRMPTISGLRRRGYTPEALQNFCERIGVAKSNSTVDFALLEHCLREDLNERAPRVMAVLRPIRVVIENYPENQIEELECPNHPTNPEMGTRKIPFSQVLYLEQEDFMENPPKKFYRLAPGREVRLRYAYFITCTSVVKDDKGNITELRCTYDPATRGGDAPDGRKVKATLHWVAAGHAIKAQVRLYDHLFTTPDPEDGGDFKANLNPKSLEVLSDCQLEPALRDAKPGTRYQFERMGYFCADSDSTPEQLVFNRTVTLKDEWVKIQKGEKK